MEKMITFPSGNLVLEGLYNKVSDTRAAIITHPHPLYGGDMCNPVVESLMHSFKRQNYTTLRFNFRGTGGSEGTYDDGISEGQDVLEAIRFLVDSGITSIHLAGYSFGSWVLAHMDEIPAVVVGMVFVSPPLALLPFKGNRSFPLLKLVITGEEDEIAPVKLISDSLAGWYSDARFEVIDFADHFYFGCFEALEQVMHEYLTGFQLS
ncbi:alpha/beta hydrolase [Desulfosediminicola flagellatus]|uniref:alpha/beta hydrolase n=1 Tax=Desulfosediminicola flagellatus TaxID=2569541 RepID=UPI0010AB7E3E|nr:alpha/beta fold hydrolase [Desulfosediminicola flagellatus]